MFFLSVCIVVLCLMCGVCLGALRVCSGRLLSRVCGSCGLSAVFASSSAFGVVLVFGPVRDCVLVRTACFVLHFLGGGVCTAVYCSNVKIKNSN
jgi:hypothetical protein